MARRLAGEISPLEMEELGMLLKESPEIHLKIQAFTELWDNSGSLPDPVPEAQYEKHVGRLKDNDRSFLQDEHLAFDKKAVFGNSKKRIVKLAVAAMVTVTVSIGIFFWLDRARQSPAPAAQYTHNTITTKYGSRTKVELPDGSIVWLNSGSKLTYDKQFGNILREVYLHGEGFFDVVHNEEKPFIIHTSFFDIKDLGTQFNVKCYPEDKTTETSLVEGSVEITVKKRPDEKWILKPNEKLVLLNDSAVSRPAAMASDVRPVPVVNEPIIAIKKLTYQAEDSFAVETAWTHNKLSFEDEAFAEVAKKMTRWYATEFEFRNKRQEDVHLSGSFVSESLEQAMEALKYTNRFKYEIKDGKIIIY